MPQNAHLEIVTADAERPIKTSTDEACNLAGLQEQAKKLARSLTRLPDVPKPHFVNQRLETLAVFKPLLTAPQASSAEARLPEHMRCLRDNSRLLSTELRHGQETVRELDHTPHVRMRDGGITPRIVALAEGFLAAAHYKFTEAAFRLYVDSFQEITALDMKELYALVPALKLALLEHIAAQTVQLATREEEIGDIADCLRSLRELSETSWQEMLEGLIIFDRLLSRDPAGAYARMDSESRDRYRNEIADIAKASGLTEMEVAARALSLAQEAQRESFADPRVALRRRHVGYYLFGEGTAALHQRTGFRPTLRRRIASFLRQHPDEFFFPGVASLTLAFMSAVLLLLTDNHTPPHVILGLMAVLLLPCSQGAVQVMNYLITSLLPPQTLPKLDFSEAVPDDCVTLVAVPCLLLTEKQVHKLVDDLEVRFLGNHDPNIHFALVTDLPDSFEPSSEDDPLVNLCSELVRNLNEKYRGQGMGSFFLLHRHRLYNACERVWMGWERKRGKLLDLNCLLQHEADNFPVKVGNTAVLSQVRYVITLDADTELPRGSAHRLVATMAHPLNQAIIDPQRNVVITGYGILQPRVGVSVQSATSSRLASIYSGETGLDIYSRAVSDVYQDLYGEGSFAGKGIYEVSTLHRVLHQRFPCDALLSHDLIEGAYARAGLVSDIQVIEDYPSRYTAYNRRKHRWLRGDWQITGWLLPVVSDQSRRLVANPISLVSRWKILDNLRRSLVEPATFLLFVLGWLVLPGSALRWTLATLSLLFVPAGFQFIFAMTRAVLRRRWDFAREAVSGLVAASGNLLLMLTFLAHQALLSLDAIVRVLVRRIVTRRRLLEWETFAQTELSAARRTPIDVYLDWTPALAFGFGVLVFFAQRSSFAPALPILALWACSKRLSLWLNQPRHASRDEVSAKDASLLRRSALWTWRYFAEFSTAEHNWLILDNVQEEPASIAARVSPTNLGLLLNARQVACEFGYLTVPEFAEQTQRTLATVFKLPRYRGHLLNWYDTRTLEPLAPMFVSSVDSGNLLASLWSLQQGALKRLRQPLLPHSLGEGLADHLRVVAGMDSASRTRLRGLAGRVNGENWLQHLLELPNLLAPEPPADSGKAKDWFAKQGELRLHRIRNVANTYAPWLLPEFSLLRDDPTIHVKFDLDNLIVERLPNFIDALAVCLEFAAVPDDDSGERSFLVQRLRSLLPGARAAALRLIQDLQTVAADAGRLADEMDFRFLLNRRRKLLSAGYDVETEQLHGACYDLLATESRIAVFAAIAKENIPQECWFTLGRGHTLDQGRPVLLSWTGTMFEYLMPTLWTRSYPNTLLERSQIAAVRSQQAFAARKRVPWGISESGFFALSETGQYHYRAFGVPQLSIQKTEPKTLVISPYSTFLALPVDPKAAVRNVRRMAREGWLGEYGFYEAADFTRSRRPWLQRCGLVRCWMAHHQGMTLLALANFLHRGVMQECFHANPRVKATELLLQEKPVAAARRRRYRTAAA
ncbi:MAG TPA: glucoamylase family protein [Terriglobales bacterium]|nr:glucoamylase family protein [Terriglobales bacterium]